MANKGHSLTNWNHLAREVAQLVLWCKWLTCLNTGSVAGAAMWEVTELLENGNLLEQVCHWGVGFDILELGSHV